MDYWTRTLLPPVCIGALISGVLAFGIDRIWRSRPAALIVAGSIPAAAWTIWGVVEEMNAPVGPVAIFIGLMFAFFPLPVDLASAAVVLWGLVPADTEG